MVGVEMRQEYVLEVGETDIGAQELALRALTAVDQQLVAPAADERRRGRPLGRGSRSRRPEEHDVQIHRASVSPPTNPYPLRPGARDLCVDSTQAA